MKPDNPARHQHEAAGSGVQRAVKGDSADGVAPYATFAALSLFHTMAVVAVHRS